MASVPIILSLAFRMKAWDALRRPIWLFDPHRLRGVYANAAALSLWGADSLDELLSRDFSQLSRAVTARTERLAQATAAGDEVSEQWTFYPNGEPVTVQATISTCHMDDGQPVLLFEASPTEVDASERRAVEALRHTSTLITLFDKDGRAIFANPAAYSAYGSMHHDFDARFADPKCARPILLQALAGDTVAEVCEIVTTDGRRWHHLDARLVQDPVTGEAGVLLNERDVTQRVEAEQARSAAEQKAAMVEARQHFLTNMSHELRTPLNSVIGFSELLANSNISSDQVEQAQRINISGKHLLGVVNEMIRLSSHDGWSGERSPELGQVTPPSSALVQPFQADCQRSARVLYVDDNESNRALITAVLSAQGIDCHTADDGQQGFEAALAGGWDLILMDIQMPVMNGVEATRAIRALSGPAAAVPIIAVTANTLDDQLEEYAEAGMNDVIAKPVDIAELISKAVMWIESRTASDTEGAKAA